MTTIQSLKPRTTFIVCTSNRSPMILVPVDKILKVFASNDGLGAMICLPNKEHHLVNESVEQVHELIAAVQETWGLSTHFE